MQALIKVQDLSKSYKKKEVLNSISLDINEGEIFGIIGMSGSGKTTILNSLIGFLEPEQGDIAYYSSSDKKYKSIYEDQRNARKIFGFSTQAASFYPRLTVKENLIHFGTLYGLDKKTILKNANNLLDITGLEKSKNSLARELSGGMEKKLSIACALIHRPKILILDEPTADLDPLSRKETWKLIEGIHGIGTTIIIASHFLNELEAVCNRMAILYDKKIVEVGTPSELKKKYFQDEEIHLITQKSDYSQMSKELEKCSSLDISKIAIKDHKLVIHTKNSESTLNKILTLTKKSKDKIINVNLTQPSLAEIFESLMKK